MLVIIAYCKKKMEMGITGNNIQYIKSNMCISQTEGAGSF